MDDDAHVMSLEPPSLPFSRRSLLLKTSLTAGFCAAIEPVWAQVITTSADGLIAGEVKVPSAGVDLPAYRAMPDKGGPFPTVLVIQEIFGVHEHIKDVCRRFAKLGYFAIAPELYARQGDPSKITETPKLISDIVNKVPDAQVMSDLLELPVTTLDGEPTTLGTLTGGRPTLLVNVASKCGLTPQYGALEALHEEYAVRGFTVIGVPCNQFGGQEPGTSEEIAEFCSTTYGVTFPMTGKVDVNGPDAHPVYQRLTAVPDAGGEAGAIQWNFEKFVIDGAGEVVGRFRPRTQPDAPEIRAAIETALRY